MAKEGSGQSDSLAIDTLFSNEALSVVDYELVFEKDHLILIRYANMGKYYEKLVWRRPGKKNVQKVLDQDCRGLRRDCIDNIYIEISDHMWEVFLGKDKIELGKKVSKEKFKEELSDCHGYLGGKFIYSGFRYEKELLPYYDWHRKTKYKKVRYFQLFATDRLGQKGELITEFRKGGGKVKIEGNELFVFRFPIDSVLVFNEDLELVRKHFLNEDAKKGNGDFYYQYSDVEDRKILKKIVLDSSKQEIDPRGIIPVPFPESVKIRNGWFYYIHHDPGEFGKRLYRVKRKENGLIQEEYEK